jgi:DNA-binding response OmpR family regulator
MHQSSVSPLARKHLSSKERQRKHLHLLPGPAIAGYQIQHNEEHQAIIINGLIVRCTPDEYRLLLLLMERYEQPVFFDELIAQFQDASLTDPMLLKAARRKLTWTLSRLRNKLWPTDFTIVLVADVGYLLLRQDRLWSIAHAELAEPDERF